MNKFQVNGLEIFYRVTEGTDPLVVFVHGAGGSGTVWENQQEGLAGFYKTLAFDLPGHGFSSGSPLPDISDYAQLISKLVPGTKPFVIVGHSMGGAIAIETALTFPERLLGMVLICTGAKLRVDTGILESLSLGQVPGDMLQRFFGSAYCLGKMENVLDEMNKVSPQVYQTDFLACNKFDRIKDLQRINLPVQIIAGEEDQITPIKFSTFLKGNLANSQVVSIKGAGHYCMLEKPQEVTSAIKEFIKTLC